MVDISRIMFFMVKPRLISGSTACWL